MRIDAHQHFWVYEPQKHEWIDEAMKAIRKDFSPSMLEEVLLENGIDGCVSVQADQTEEETNTLVQFADRHPFIKGVVGWIDLQAPDIHDRLQHYAQFPTIKGYRHVVQGEADPAFLGRPGFRNGIKALKDFDLAYDILIFPHQLKSSFDFASAFPQQRFIIDHMAKPYIKKGLIDEWKKDMANMAALDNVWCKISGLVTEADWERYKPEDLFPYIETAIEAFGIDRVVYGSDWPVCLVAASYEKVYSMVQQVFDKFTREEGAKFFGLNAVEFYKLTK